MLDGLEGAVRLFFRNEKTRLILEADEAFHAKDKAGCVDAIERLYCMFDDERRNCRIASS